MTGIEERAQHMAKANVEACETPLTKDAEPWYYFGYCDGAEDQQEIDIEKACEIYKRELVVLQHHIRNHASCLEDVYVEDSVREFKETLEKELSND